MKVKIGIITVSDRASKGIYEDISGPGIIDTLNDYLTTEWEADYQVIPDEQYLIESTIKQMADNERRILNSGKHQMMFVLRDVALKKMNKKNFNNSVFYAL